MKTSGLEKLFHRIAAIGAKPDDDEELRLQKSLLVICAIPFALAGAAWGTMYIRFGETTAGLIPFGYALISTLSIVAFGVTRRFDVFRFSQLLFILLLPFALMMSLGGFVNGSAVIIWSSLSTVGAMLFGNRRMALGWLIAFAALVVISFLVQPHLRESNNLTATQIRLFFLFNIVAVSSLIFMMVYYFVVRRNFYQARSESLLLNILPKEIANELKANGSAAARHFDSVTVMFTDFKDFTQIAENITPAALVAEIDRYFKAFDAVVEKHNLEKIKTIGDAYMCAGGLPVPNTTHAVDAVSAALELQRFIKQRSAELHRDGKPSFNMRVVIHTGAVVAGIVGSKKFAYDIWGDTVNLAARMESSGEEGKVNISGSTYALVKHQFVCEYRGKIHAKHKGDVDMYFVEHREELLADMVREKSVADKF